MPPAKPLAHNRPHDYPYLVRRWKRIASDAGLAIDAFAEAGGFPIYWCRTRNPLRHPAIYLSAGIHGDEPGATEGLVAWAQNNSATLRAGSFVIFPCLNPWGLQNNVRYDAGHRDLNRSYNDDSVPQIVAQKRLLLGRRFAAAIALHEDYDGQGIYIYEIVSQKPWLAEPLLRAASRFLPVEPRRSIEGRSCRNGVVRRAVRPELMPRHPEAFFLHSHHSTRTLTVETPSEFAIDARADAHAAAIDALVHLVGSEKFTPQKSDLPYLQERLGG